MALSYSLDVNAIQNMEHFSEALVSIGQYAAIPSGPFGARGAARWNGPTGAYQDIFPTGEYVVRKGMYVNGSFIYVGSYKAYFVDLYGAGNHGYAWDGFIMFFRGYSIKDYPFITTLNNGAFSFAGDSFGMLPMRMPFEVNPGPIGDAADIADDSSVGLYGLDIFKDYDDYAVQSSDDDIRIMTCGFQRINASAESAPTGMDYVGNIYMGRLLRATGRGTVQNSAGEQITILSYEYYTDDMMQITWRANQANHTDKTWIVGQFRKIRELDQALALNEVGSSITYTYANWSSGILPDGTNPSGGSTGSDVRCISFDYFPRRFFDITCVSNTPYSASAAVSSAFSIVGDLSLDTDNDGTIDDTCPMLIGGAYPFDDFINDAPQNYLPPYFQVSAAVATNAASAPSWFREDLTPSYSLSGAVAVAVSVPYEAISLTGTFPYDNYPLTMVAVNGVSHSGTDYGEIYATEDTPISTNAELLPIAVQGGSFTTATGISLPNRWWGKAVQQRTFTISEEDAAKAGQTDANTGEFFPTSQSVYDEDGQEYIGFRSNYQRYGAFNLETASSLPSVTQGDLTGSGYGFLGLKTGTGPVAIMFDSGSPAIDGSVSPPSFDGVFLAEGSNLNANHVTNPSSTTRSIINCGWDNDRDQWLFLSSDSSGVGVISAASNFTTASNNVGFLDQTSNFSIASIVNAGIYTPISMSNSMDGFIFFGSLDSGSEITGILSPSLGASESITVEVQKDPPFDITYDAYPSAKTYLYRITGTTGRTARVWVDYVLFDGVDSVIATKLKGLGMKVNIENVEWFKRNIIRTGDLNIRSEEIEEWMRQQQSQYKEMLKTKERQGRLRKRKSQVSAYREGMEEQINPDFMDSEVKDYIDTFIPKERPPSPTEKKLERKRKGGYEPKQSSYYDEVFEDEP